MSGGRARRRPRRPWAIYVYINTYGRPSYDLVIRIWNISLTGQEVGTVDETKLAFTGKTRRHLVLKDVSRRITVYTTCCIRAIARVDTALPSTGASGRREGHFAAYRVLATVATCLALHIASCVAPTVVLGS